MNLFIEHNSRQRHYRSPSGAVAVGAEIRIRVAVGSFAIPDRVSLIAGDANIPMYYVAEIAGNRLFECFVTMPGSPELVWYYFLVEADGETLYYGNNALCLGGLGEASKTPPLGRYQITVYQEGFKTPDWIKDTVVYQIFPDRFCRGEKTPVKGIERRWGDEPYYSAAQFGGEYLSNDFFGGNLSGITQKLPYLKDLGITAIYLNPIFEAASNHRYDTGDYETVDEALGGNEAFDGLAAAAKAHGIRLILDGVFSHTGADSKYFNKNGNYDSVGAYQSKASPYYPWYIFKKHPDEYESWWGFKSLPNVRETEPGYMDYMLTSPDAIVKRWLKRGTGGWRLDVADELPDEFIRALRRAVKTTKSDAVIIGEVWEDASNKISYGSQRQFLWGGALDSVMNYVLRGAIMDYLTEKTNAQLFVERLFSMKENYPKEAFYSALNLLSGHDIPRALTVLGSGADIDLKAMRREEQAKYKLPPERRALAQKRMALAALLQMTLPGAPCVYYGDEAGLDGCGDPFNRRCYPWGKEDKAMLALYQKMIALRKERPSLVTGDLEPLLYYDRALCFMRAIVGGKDVFGRERGDECVIVALNADREKGTAFELELGRYGICELCGVWDGKVVALKDHKAVIALAPLDYQVFIAKKDEWWKKTRYTAPV